VSLVQRLGERTVDKRQSEYHHYCEILTFDVIYLYNHDSQYDGQIITHGLTLRLFLMRWYRFSVSQFENSVNPKNGAVVVMTRCPRDEHHEASLSERLTEDDEFVYQELFSLDEESLREMNIPKSISTPKSTSETSHDIEMLLQEARDGYGVIGRMKHHCP